MKLYSLTNLLAGFVVLCWACASNANAQELKKSDESPKQSARSSAEPSKEQLEREKAFGELMSGAVLEGNFTTKGADAKKLPSPEKYTLGKVTKQKDDVWLFEARIQYGKHDVTLPLPLRVVWSGDTPVITLDKFLVPGFGTFTCRVMIYDNQYAGMWDGGNHGGLLFGKISKPDEKKAEEKKNIK
jgi:hypothetical protein